MRVYLAGRIYKNCWRHEIVSGLAGATSGECETPDHKMPERWPTMAHAIFNAHDYVGPYFVGCDHGCQHDCGRHGYLSGNEHGSTFVTPVARERIVELCRDAILRCEIFYAWMEDAEAYGTIAELGYARGLGKPTYLFTPDMVNLSEVWFSLYLANYRGYAENAVEGFKTALAIETQTPIEKSFWDEARDIFNLTPQYQIGRYRVDFALVEDKVVVELDGHDSHKSKEQRTYDAARERFLQTEGWKVVRFTGSEVFRDVMRCVGELHTIVYGD